MRIKNIMGFKKSSRSVAALAGIIVVAVMLTCVLNACAPAEEKTVESTTTSATTSIQLTDETSSEPEEREEELSPAEEYWTLWDEGTSGTNGELEDQMEYMVLRSDYPNADIYVQDISDTSGIEDEDIREAAQYYIDKGYQVFDQETELERRTSLGDGEYMFKYGFYAIYRDTTGSYGDPNDWNDGDWIDTNIDVYVYKMNETLFEYFIVEGHGSTNGFFATFNKPRDTVEDDGTIIRYTDSYTGSIAEFDRETGLATITSESIQMSDQQWIDGIENEAFRDLTQSYFDQGYDLGFFDPNNYYYFDLFFELDYPYSTGFEIVSMGETDPVFGTTEMETIGYVYEADEELFEAILESGYYGNEVTRDDDGTVIRVSMEEEFEIEYSDDEVETCTYSCNIEFNRDTNSMMITDEIYDYGS